MCGPCSCHNSNRNSASNNNGNQSVSQSDHVPVFTLSLSLIAGGRRETVRLRVDTWWRKPTIPEKFRTNQPRPAGAGRESEKKIVEED